MKGAHFLVSWPAWCATHDQSDVELMPEYMSSFDASQTCILERLLICALKNAVRMPCDVIGMRSAHGIPTKQSCMKYELFKQHVDGMSR